MGLVYLPLHSAVFFNAKFVGKYDLGKRYLGGGGFKHFLCSPVHPLITWGRFACLTCAYFSTWVLQNHRSCLRFEYPNVFVTPKKSRCAEIYNIPTLPTSYSRSAASPEMGHVLKAATEEAEELARHHFAAERREGTASMARYRWGERDGGKTLEKLQKNRPFKKNGRICWKTWILGGFFGHFRCSLLVLG